MRPVQAQLCQILEKKLHLDKIGEFFAFHVESSIFILFANILVFRANFYGDGK